MTTRQLLECMLTVLALSVLSTPMVKAESSRKYLLGLVERKIAQDTARTLEAKGYAEPQVEEILKSNEFRHFVARVIADPSLQAAVDHFMEAAAGQRVAPQKERPSSLEARLLARGRILEAQAIAHRTEQGDGDVWTPKQLWLGLRRVLLE